MGSSARRAWTKEPRAGGDDNGIIQRTPDIILDTRLNDTGTKSTHKCDECEEEFHGPYQGSHLAMVRELTYHELAEGWKSGKVDATWYCIDCWADKLKVNHDKAREDLELPPKATPTKVEDNRFSQHSDRWSICDNCQCHCTGRARDYLPGSFVYRMDGKVAGPPNPRSTCFPKLGEREALWRRGEWNAAYLCRQCLVTKWGKTPTEITDWLLLQHGGGAKAAALNRRQQARPSHAKGRGKDRHDHTRDHHDQGEWWAHRRW